MLVSLSHGDCDDTGYILIYNNIKGLRVFFQRGLKRLGYRRDKRPCIGWCHSVMDTPDPVRARGTLTKPRSPQQHHTSGAVCLVLWCLGSAARS